MSVILNSSIYGDVETAKLTSSSTYLPSDSGVLLSTLILLLSDSSVYISASVPSIYQLAYLRIIRLSPYIATINNVRPDLTGTILLLGSLCISVVDTTDITDILRSTPSDSHTINIFDGCKACNDCDTIWDTMQLVKLCHIWTVGLKDCVLYYLPAAQKLWDRLFSDRNILMDLSLSLTTYIVDTSGNCRYKAQLMPLHRRSLLRRATKLLYQYKAVVAMWNYLVYNASSRMRVLTTFLDYTGVSVKLKRRFNLCLNPLSSITLNIKARRSGQALSGLVRLQSDSALQELSQTSDAQPIPYALSFCVYPVQLNTYILRYTDRGGMEDDPNVQHYSSNSSDILITTTILYLNLEAVINTAVVFRPGLSGGLLTCAAQIKFLPVFQSIDQPSTTNLDLASYAQAVRKNATYYPLLLSSTNRWYILTLWLCDNLPSMQDAAYYTTAYNLYPTRTVILTLLPLLLEQ